MFDFFNTDKLYYSYKGIKKAEFPKWQGWEIIDAFKKQGIHVSEINDETLNILFENFVLLYMLKRILREQDTYSL